MVNTTAKISLASTTPANNLKANFPSPEVVTTKSASIDGLMIKSATQPKLTKHSLTSKKVEDLQGQLNNLHVIVRKVEEMETKLIGEMNNSYNNLAALTKANVAKPV